ncbi:MAG: phage holin family protein [Clostridia bacterium]
MSKRITQNIVRFILSLAIFVFTVFLTPNFNISNIYILFISSLFVIILDYLVSTITGIHDYPIGRGIVGFFSCIVIIYATQFFISGYYISIFSSIIAALIYSAVDYMLPNKEME